LAFIFPRDALLTSSLLCSSGSLGTWVPIERGLALSKQYNVEDLMRPIIDYIPTAESPPQAPKHITAVPVRNKKVAKGDTPAQASTATTADGEAGPSTPALSSRQISRAANLAAQAQAKATAAKELAAERKEKRERDKEDKRLAAEAAARDASFEGDETFSGDEDSVNGSLSAGSSNSRTPSPVGGSEDEDYEAGQGDSTTSKRKRKFKDGYEPSTHRQRLETNPNNRVLQNAHQPDNSYHHSHPSHPHHPDDNVYIPPPEDFVGPERYEDTILDYFISESSQIPSILINPPLDFDPNVPIDDDGHTALHWACAMGRIRVVKLLLTAGADIYRVNQSEQTALMRSVMFSNNYDVRKFPELYELLHRSTLNIDKQNRTVFHHISDVALSKGKTHAARYYMETILGRLADYPKELGDVINFQDDDGETALTLAARARSKRLVKSLLDHGADPKLANRDGKTAQDYILEDERFRASPQVGTTGLLPSNANGNNGALTNTNYINHNNPLNPASFHNASSSSSSANANGLSSLSSQQPPLPSPIPRIYHSSTAQLAASRTTTELTHLLASLAQSFDAELQGKERDLVQTNSLVSHIQKEILETRRMAEAMKVKLGNQLEEGVRELGRLEGELERELEERYKGGWREWRKAQQEGEGEVVKKVEGGEMDGVEGEGESQPTEGELEALRVKVLVRGREKRREMFKKYLELERERGTADELVKSRMIVKDAARLDGDGEGDVDDILEALLEVSSRFSFVLLDYRMLILFCPSLSGPRV
jgi:transcription factor MBP1